MVHTHTEQDEESAYTYTHTDGYAREMKRHDVWLGWRRMMGLVGIQVIG